MSDALRERTIRWGDPSDTAEKVKGLSGVEALRLLRDGGTQAPIGSLMNFRLVEVDEGRVVFEGEPAEYHYNPIGSVHGGFALTLFDSALGCAVHSALPAGVGYASTDVQVRFVRGMHKDTGTVRCEARALHVGRTTAIAEARLIDGSGKLLGTGTTACAVFRPPVPRRLSDGGKLDELGENALAHGDAR